MKMTKGVITRAAAVLLSPQYVKFVEFHDYGNDEFTAPFYWDHDKPDRHGYPTCGLKKGQKMLTYHDGQYIVVKVSSIKNPQHDADGPIVRVSNEEYSWRVDGDKYGVVLP